MKFLKYFASFLLGWAIVIIPVLCVAAFSVPEEQPVMEQVISHYGSYNNIVDDYIPEIKTMVTVVKEYPSCKEIFLDTHINKEYRVIRKTYYVKNDMSYTEK